MTQWLRTALVLGVAGLPPALGAELEELTITGRMARLEEARVAIIRAEDAFHARYNELNPQDQFDIECREEAPTGRIIRTRVCEPRYVLEAMQSESDRITGNQADANVMVLTAETVFTAQKARFQQHMKELALKHPELLQLLAEHDRRVKAYQALSKSRFRKDRG